MARKDAGAKQIPLLEWLVAAAGVAILGTMLVFLAIDAVKTNESSPPLLEVEPTRVSGAPGAYVVEIKVRNRSRNTAAAVHVEGELKQAGTVVETSTATVDYVPGQAEERAGLMFRADPSKLQLDTRVTGYVIP